MADVRVQLRVNYGGSFQLNARKVLVYKKKFVHWFIDVDPDLISKVVLEDMFMTDIGLPKPVKEFWFQEPGKTLNKGLRRVDDDRGSMEMMNYTDGKGRIHVYVIQDGEPSPAELKADYGTSSRCSPNIPKEDAWALQVLPSEEDLTPLQIMPPEGEERCSAGEGPCPDSPSIEL